MKETKIEKGFSLISKILQNKKQNNQYESKNKKGTSLRMSQNDLNFYAKTLTKIEGQIRATSTIKISIH